MGRYSDKLRNPSPPVQITTLPSPPLLLVVQAPSNPTLRILKMCLIVHLTRKE